MSADENYGLVNQGHQFLAVSSDYLKGPLGYQDAPIGLKISPAQINPSIAEYWSFDDNWISAKIENDLIGPNIQNPDMRGTTKYKRLANNMAVSFCCNKESFPSDPEYWRSWILNLRNSVLGLRKNS